MSMLDNIVGRGKERWVVFVPCGTEQEHACYQGIIWALLVAENPQVSRVIFYYEEVGRKG